MNQLNSILIEGNLTRDPEISYTPQGTAVGKFAIATNSSYKSGEEWIKEVSFFNVLTWARLAEVCAAHLTKGRGVRIVGKLKQSRWTDEQGTARSIIQIVAEHVEFKPVTKQDVTTGTDEQAAAEAVETDDIPI
ncbi:MAG: single-stranded DNA-binding protein [Clostridiales bacterium]|nr:single-stranded DNA-binding protein [Clostridiales bacterium]